jgi:hypothetical protein
MPGRMSGSVSAALSGSGSCDFVPGSSSGCLVSGSSSGSCDFLPGSSSGCLVSGSATGCEARHYNLHMLPGRVSEA